MATEVILPRVDMDMATGRIARWYVAEGSFVQKGQPIFEIETDKAAMEIESPETGVLSRLVEEADVAIPIGSRVGWILAPGETPPTNAAAPVAATPELSPDASDQRLPPVPLAKPEASLTIGQNDASTTTARPASTPLARRLAKQYGLDIASVSGSGPRCRIQAADVKAAHQANSLDALAVTCPVPDRPSPPKVSQHAESLSLRWLQSGYGTPLLLIHGFGSDLTNWRPFLAALGSNRPVVGIDLPGHGTSPALAHPSLIGLAEAVEHQLVAEGLGEADLIGHSLGGAVAAMLAEAPGFQSRSLLLLSPAGLGPDINGAFIAGFTRASCEASLAPWMRLLVADPQVISPAMIRATARARANTTLIEAQSALAQALFPDGTQAFSIRPVLERLEIPLRVVFGTEDRIIPARHADSLPELAAVHRLRGIGHMPHLENRAILAQILRHHLGQG